MGLERRLEARNTPSLADHPLEAEEEECWDEEDDGVATNRTSPADVDDSHPPPTAEQIRQASQWPYRYLGMHCKPEDALDWDDRIHPRAGSRLGPKHQANVVPWYGQAVKLVKPLEIKRVGKKDSKQSKEAAAALEAEKLARETRPKWIQDEPPGYVARGEDLPNDDPNNTATLLWAPPAASGSSMTDSEIDAYMSEARAKATAAFDLPPESTNLRDVAMQTLFKNNFNAETSLKKLLKLEKSEFKEPDLTPAEVKKFEEGISKFGSELYLTTKHVKTVEHRRIVRFYYTWKKTQKGRQIWGNYVGRKGKKEAKIAEANANKLQDDVADGNDDSAFDTEKALERKRTFMCKFCSTKSSRQWRRAPAGGPVFIMESVGKNKDKVQHIAALCRRCAELWRRYAIQWEDVEDLAKKVAAAGGRSWKRRVDEELLKELIAANEMMSLTVYSTPPPSATQATAVATPTPAAGTETHPPRKKLKTSASKDSEPHAAHTAHSPEAAASTNHAPPKRKEKEKEKEKVIEKPAPPPPPPVPEIPKQRMLPCAICNQMNPTGDQHRLSCKECRLTVHRKCYGVIDNRQPGKWTCDMCLNDKNPQVSIVSSSRTCCFNTCNTNRDCLGIQVCPLSCRVYRA
ncbi:putative PHD type zinc finger protein with BAH domain-containing protein [Diatrype stigma]|uniref:PHD type zinc finger protein with BAH domain-containing protein n=1 Tax=Diatrype stigma TaxID=117547 RepID=A0AAN9V0E4_9PEZI